MLAGVLAVLLAFQAIQPVERTFKVTFYCSCKLCCGRHSPQLGGRGTTAMGHAPVQNGTGAVGDPGLLGRWIYFEDLGGFVFASDTGAKCQARPRKAPRNWTPKP